jgi:CDP-diacylglycerol--serine O-phosphatidyltransferase
MLDGRIARMTGSASEFGVQFDSLADVISFGIAPAILAFSWGLQPLGRYGWLASFLFLTAAAMRLARFNLQSGMGGDKRYFAGMPSPAAAGVIAATVYAYPQGLADLRAALPALALVLLPAALMVSTIRFRSFKTINFGWTPSYINIILVAGLIALVATSPRVTLLVISYGYLLSAFVEMAVTRFRTLPPDPLATPEE